MGIGYDLRHQVLLVSVTSAGSRQGHGLDFTLRLQGCFAVIKAGQARWPAFSCFVPWKNQVVSLGPKYHSFKIRCLESTNQATNFEIRLGLAAWNATARQACLRVEYSRKQRLLRMVRCQRSQF